MIRAISRHNSRCSVYEFIKFIAVLFLVLSALGLWWAFADLIPNGNKIPGFTISALAAIHIVVMIGVLRDTLASRTMMVILPWTWVIVLPIGTVLAVLTLATLPNLPVHPALRHEH